MSSSITPFYDVSDDQKSLIRQYYGKTPQDIEQQIDILRQWIRQQAHLPQTGQDDGFLERFLLRHKFQLEDTKNSLERYYSIRAPFVEMFRNVTLVPPSKHLDQIVPMPLLSDNLERVLIVRSNPHWGGGQQDSDQDSVMQFFKCVMSATEIYIRQDYSLGSRIIHDFHGFTLSHFRHFSAKMATFSSKYQEAYYGRVMGIEYVNTPPFSDLLLQASRIFLPPVVFQRITVHKSLESLHSHVPPHLLPEEYGGNLGPIDKYLEQSDENFLQNAPHLDTIMEQVTDEKKRVGPVPESHMFGQTGTFRNLCVD